MFHTLRTVTGYLHIPSLLQTAVICCCFKFHTDRLFFSVLKTATSTAQSRRESLCIVWKSFGKLPLLTAPAASWQCHSALNHIRSHHPDCPTTSCTRQVYAPAVCPPHFAWCKRHYLYICTIRTAVLLQSLVAVCRPTQHVNLFS
jgi:hypothetical protein